MIKQSAAILLTLSLCLAACNRGGGNNNSAKAAAANQGDAAVPAAGGNAAAAAAAPDAGQSGVAVALDSEGLRAVEEQSGRTSLLAFGRPVDEALQSLNRLFGANPTEDGTNEECGGGPMRIVQWANGVTILASDGIFSGWQVDEAGPTTINGIGVGSTRAQLDEALDPEVQESTLGTEFATGEGDSIGGLLSADGAGGRVTTMWAGDTCHFR